MLRLIDVGIVDFLELFFGWLLFDVMCDVVNVFIGISRGWIKSVLCLRFLKLRVNLFWVLGYYLMVVLISIVINY